ncbi:MAG: dephospho-CoA kinase [Microthrixaceae bacterium]|nr:dephospho-CoA kinase [Microthrixaceae bacterium]MCO5314067.1 dephospho-CoA kinase [Microthrixaceae bacterium]
MILVGLTGGIGSGKTTVSAGLAARGAVVIDADRIVHELQSPGQQVLAEMVERFGEEILHPDGTLNRQAVADRVFGDEEALADLGKIVHPRVSEEIFRRVAEQDHTDNIVVLDIPLLTESGWEGMVGTIVVDLDTELAVQRLMAHRSFPEADARARIARQATREERRAGAWIVIDNSGDFDDLERLIDDAWEQILAKRDEVLAAGFHGTVTLGRAADRGAETTGETR